MTLPIAWCIVPTIRSVELFAIDLRALPEGLTYGVLSSEAAPDRMTKRPLLSSGGVTASVPFLGQGSEVELVLPM